MLVPNSPRHLRQDTLVMLHIGVHHSDIRYRRPVPGVVVHENNLLANPAEGLVQSGQQRANIARFMQRRNDQAKF
jgi:hypothetical protein